MVSGVEPGCSSGTPLTVGVRDETHREVEEEWRVHRPLLPEWVVSLPGRRSLFRTSSPRPQPSTRNAKDRRHSSGRNGRTSRLGAQTAPDRRGEAPGPGPGPGRDRGTPRVAPLSTCIRQGTHHCPPEVSVQTVSQRVGPLPPETLLLSPPTKQVAPSSFLGLFGDVPMDLRQPRVFEKGGCLEHYPGRPLTGGRRFLSEFGVSTPGRPVTPTQTTPDVSRPEDLRSGRCLLS